MKSLGLWAVSLGFGVQGLDFRGWGFGLRFLSGIMVQGVEFAVWGVYVELESGAWVNE